MGNYYSSSETWYVYSRDLTSESWIKQPIHQSEEKILGIFKHLIYKFALQIDETNKNYKSVYLYQGSTRYIKAELIRPESDSYYKLVLDFKNSELATEWDMQDEQIINANECMWKEVEFNKFYVSLPENCTYKRRWQLIKKLSLTNKLVPNLTITQYIKYSNGKSGT